MTPARHERRYRLGHDITGKAVAETAPGIGRGINALRNVPIYCRSFGRCEALDQWFASVAIFPNPRSRSLAVYQSQVKRAGCGRQKAVCGILMEEGQLVRGDNDFLREVHGSVTIITFLGFAQTFLSIDSVVAFAFS